MGNTEEREAGRKVGELWELVFKKLTLWTIRKHRMKPADAEETVQEGIRQFLQAGGVADPADPAALLEALGSKINGIAINRRRKKADRAVRLTVDGSLADHDDAADSAPDAERRVFDGDTTRKAVSALLVRVEGDELATQVVMQTLEGVEDPADQAKALGREVHDVYKARRRLKTHTEAIEKLMEEW